MKFIEDRDAGKATLVGSDETEPELYVRDVPDGSEFDAEMAGRVCLLTRPPSTMTTETN
ncbi:hypothetical protein [Halocatena marina]|uniref:hypothetical protein n=1 Tax=Halocatena marina TaxID=2934937 RepID=UPI0035A13B13